MIIAKHNTSGKLHPFKDIDRFKSWCRAMIRVDDYSVDYITSLKVYSLDEGDEMSDDKQINMSIFYTDLKAKPSSLIEGSTPITDSLFHDLDDDIMNSKAIGDWVYRLGLLLDKKIPLGNGLHNTHRIEIAIRQFSKL